MLVRDHPLVAFNSVAVAVEHHLTEREWSQADLAHVLGWSAQSLSDLLKRRSRLRPQDALDLSHALGRSPEEWLAIQSRDDLREANTDPDIVIRLRSIATRSRIASLLPSRELIRRGVLPGGNTIEMERAALDLLGIQSFDDQITFPASARRSAASARHSRMQLAWVAEVRSRLHPGLPSVASSSDLAEFGASLAGRIGTSEALRNLPARFAELGIGLTYVPAYAGAKIDGVCTIVDRSPLIAVSGRGGRLDKVTFTIAHELAHVALGHLESHPFFISDDEIDSDPKVDHQEAQADLLASHWLIPQFDDLKRQPISAARISEFADRHGIPGALVIGRLQREGLVPWNSQLNRSIPNVKEDLEAWT